MKLFLAFTILIFVFSYTNSFSAQKPDKPNIVLILADDMGWGDVRSNGNMKIETPVLDRLAENSLSFDRFYVCPLCAPTRAEMLTGRYFLRTGVSSVSQGYENMDPRETTIAQILKQNGYTTGCFGKWHNGAWFQQHPNRKGFDEYIGFMVGHLGYYFDAIYQHNDEDVKSDGYATDYFTSQALDFIEKNSGKPFFCYVPYNVPHSPFQVPAKYFEKYKAKGLDDELACIHGMVENMDDNIGLILSKLDELKISDNTIVIFLSDNGPNTYRYNGVMKGKKGSVDEGGVRVPFYISWPEKIKPGVTEQLAQDIDIMPTLLSLCSISDRPELPMDGKNLTTVILKNANPHDRIIFSRQGFYPLSRCADAVRNNNFRLVVSLQDTLLFDMIADPAQKQDISENQPEIKKELLSAYLKWENEMVSNYQVQTTIKAGFPEEKSITLPVQDAVLSGKVKFSSVHPNQSHTENWVENGDSITWKLDIQQTGKYKVELRYGCPADKLGSQFKLSSNADSFDFAIDKAFNSEILPNRDYVPRSESVERTWDWMPIGTISVKKGEEKLSLKLIDKKASEAGLIKAIRLIKF
ncbi:MAG: arylsulfatase [Draconibacterium sp.]|nr:arylsulfatase [Draconibacterium sp.]